MKALRRPSGADLAEFAGVAPAFLAVALMLLWAYHDGGYDADTWYWGALVLLAALAFSVARRGGGAVSPAVRLAIVCFGAYVAWSYLSIAWAGSPGAALDGSNRALLYLIVFCLFAVQPWSARTAIAALLCFALGLGAIEFDVLWRLAHGSDLSRMVLAGRLVATTGYFNSTVALLTTGALVATLLSARRELPALLRGLLLAIACGGIQLAVVGQSRGWLFTLPLILLLTAALARNRFRATVAAGIVVLAALAVVHRLLAVFQGTGQAALTHAAQRAGHASLIVCAGVFVLGTVLAWVDAQLPERELPAGRRRMLGAALCAFALGAGLLGGLAVTHGDPLGFVKREWNGFSRPESNGTGSHFATVGSGRYDFWRVALEATGAHPLGGLGQDNYGDYYITHRRTTEEPAWPHSLELTLLASTGVVGLLSFAAFLVVALRAAAPAIRRQSGLAAAAAATALLPLVDWVVHGSVDWFWQVPALSAPALGFLGLAAALGSPAPVRAPAAQVARAAGRPEVDRPARGMRQRAWPALACTLLLGAVFVLGSSYLSVREVSVASDAAATDPGAALRDLSLAAALNPLSPVPGRLGGAIALQNGLLNEAEQRFSQAIAREPGGWFAWFGKGLAASALGEESTARSALAVAESINNDQLVIKDALARVDTTRPLTPQQALQLLTFAG